MQSYVSKAMRRRSCMGNPLSFKVNAVFVTSTLATLS
jgi:hypothetical protein